LGKAKAKAQRGGEPVAGKCFLKLTVFGGAKGGGGIRKASNTQSCSKVCVGKNISPPRKK